MQFTDERFECEYVIGSHFDYWDFLGYLVDHKQWPTRPLTVSLGVADNGPGARRLSLTRRRERFPSRGCRDGAPGPHQASGPAARLMTRPPVARSLKTMAEARSVFEAPLDGVTIAEGVTEDVARHLGDRLLRVLLYGSWARGDARHDSESTSWSWPQRSGLRTTA